MVVADHQCPPSSPWVYLTVSVFALGMRTKTAGVYVMHKGEMECEGGPCGGGDVCAENLPLVLGVLLSFW